MKNNLLIRSVWIICLIFSSVPMCWCQAPPQNWYQLDLKTDGYAGVSSNKAYSELLKGKTGQPVIVAVIDGGSDIIHEDLQSNIWSNPKEISGNGIDDDKNGFVDDIHGWDFIGGKNGDVQYDTYELTRLYKILNSKYADINPAQISSIDKNEYNRYLKIKSDYETKSKESTFNYQLYNGILHSLKEMLADLGSENPTLEQVQNYKPEDDSSMVTQQMLVSILKEGASVKDIIDELNEGIQSVEADAKYHFNPDFDPRSIVGDNYNDDSEHFYGNSDVKGPDAMHGTHVAGIIGAVQNNNLGINGIADHVQLMIIRVVPDGDERDKDVGNAIRYAVDNGARVINMSFGKSYSYDKKAVDDAVKYAASKDVLLVHAAGNDAEDNDSHDRFPNARYSDGGSADNWIEVGSSSWNNDVAEFSCYGKKTVDVWAPGVAIYSTVPDNKYRNLQGTSMSSPVVTGIAAIIRSYYPQLTALQVKDILMKSVVKMNKKVTLPGSPAGKKEKVKPKSISVTGGVVNAYKAVQLATKSSHN